MQKVVCIIFLVMVSSSLPGQDQKSFRYSDSITYSLYMEKNWTELIARGKEALNNGHDYYYMRMRLGIAYYEKHNYAMASKHFEKAQEFSFNDQLTLEYLFYSAFLTNRHYQAWSILSGSFPETRKRIIEESKFGRNTLTAESFYSNSNTEDLLSSPSGIFTDPEPGSQSVTRFYLNSSIYASHILGKKFAYFHTYTNLIKDSYLHYFNGTDAADFPEQKLVQNQYYGAFNFFGPGGWSFSPAFHVLLSSYPYPYTYGNGMNTQISTSTINDFSYVTSFRLSRSGGFLSLGTEAAFSELNGLTQAQGSVSLTLYPLGNTRFYLGGSLSAIYSLEGSSDPLPLIYGIIAGFSVADKVWLEFSGSDGYMNNWLEGNGLYVYNSSDIIKRKVTARLIVPFVKPGISLYAGAGRSWMSSKWIPEDGVNSDNSNIIEYFNNNFTGGISWNF
jgi:hypothetical protein